MRSAAGLTHIGRARDGATAVEFALVLPPLLLLVFGVMEFGQVMWTRQALQHVVIAGARCMGLVQSACGTAGVYNASMTTSFVQAQAAAWSLTLPSSNITLNAAATCGGVSGFSQVSVTYSFNSVVPALIQALASSTLQASACFPNHP